MKHSRILLLAIGIIAMHHSGLYAQDADLRFQEGMIKAEGEGNLEEAINIYNQIVNDLQAERGIRAKALMQVGICYEKLGKENARLAYEKLVSEFSDQQEFVSLARQKLNDLHSSSPAAINSDLSIQQLKQGLRLVYMLAGVSPDGSSFLYIDQVNNDDEIVRFDLTTGNTKKLTDNNSSGYGQENVSSPLSPIWSPDGEYIAYYREVYRVEGENVDISEIRMMDKNGGNDQILISGSSREIPGILSFTPDGKCILGTLVEPDNARKRKLVLFSIETKNTTHVKDLDENYGTRYVFSPDGEYLLFVKKDEHSANQDVYAMNMHSLEETQVTFDSNRDWGPVWSPGGDQIVFLSNRLNSNDLYKIGFNNGKIVGKPVNVKAGLGDNLKIMGVDHQGAVYFSTRNERFDILALNLEDLFNHAGAEPVTINNPASTMGGYAPRFSKDGRYISYLNNIRFRDQPSDDLYLGEKYLINIYDTQTGKNRLLDTDLHVNFYTRELLWRLPSWSYDHTKLLVYGAVKDNYQGGFYSVDVFTEEVVPIYTRPGHKKGTNYERLGNMGIFSRDNQSIYYTSPDFKELREFNLITQEETSHIYNNDGFWFHGFIDNQETKCIAINRFGYFFHDIGTDVKTRFASRDDGDFMGKTDDGTWYFLLKEKTIRKISTDGMAPEKSVSVDPFFENMQIIDYDISHDGRQAVFNVIKTTGQEVNKIVNAFDSSNY